MDSFTGKKVICVKAGRVFAKIDNDKNVKSTLFETYGQKIGMVVSSGLCFSTDVNSFGKIIGQVQPDDVPPIVNDNVGDAFTP